MPLLLEDLAEETSASDRRIADRLYAEARNLDERRRAKDALLGEIRQKAVEAARLGTDFAVSVMHRQEEFMRQAVALLREEPFGDAVEVLLRTLLDGFKSGQELVRAVRLLVDTAEQIGVVPERLDELRLAEQRLEELAAEAKRALEHRTHEWQPADPDRLAQGLQLAREGKTVKADEARTWFCREPS